MIKKKYFILILLFISVHSFAQQFLGFGADAWSGVTAVSFNPAVSDNRNKVDFNIFSMDIGAMTDAKNIQAPLLFQNFKEPRQFFDPSFTTNRGLAFPSSSSVGTSEPLQVIKQTHAQGPGSFIASFGHNKNEIGFSYNYHNVQNYSNIPQSLAQIMTEYLNQSRPIATSVNASSGKITSMAWAEAGITYSRVAVDNGKHLLKAGITLKYLQGLGTSYLNIKQLAYTDSNSNQGMQTRIRGDVDYGSTTKTSSPGFGFDLGVIYEWRPDIEKDKYEMDGERGIVPRDMELHKLAFGASLMDVGAIKYTKMDNYGTYNGIDYNPTDKFRDSTFNTTYNLGTVQPLVDSALVHRQSYSSKGDVMKVSLPTHINLFMDWQIVKGLHLNLSGLLNLNKSDSKLQVHYPGYSTLAISYNRPWIGLSIPFTYIPAVKQSGVGLVLRLGELFVGTRNIMGFFGSGANGDNCSVFVGLKVAIPYHRPKDSDGDYISNAIDKCPHLAGVHSANGCPDADGDGLQDKEDSCKTLAGPQFLHGCPDADNDSIPDKADECPNERGLKVFKGCPDSDRDSVPDRFDRCPDKKGLVGMKGCPDNDKDGVASPDDDDDEVAGPVENRGVPWPDRDGDGVLDKDDQCPDVKGTLANGCPDLTAAAILSKTLLGRVLFDDGKSELKLADKADIVRILKSLNKDENNYSSIRIEAFAEEGEPEVEGLAEMRAKSLRNFLIENKYPEEKITMDYSTVPKSSNNNKVAKIFSTY